MLRAAIGFFIIGIVAFILGAGNIGVISMETGRVLLGVFLILAVVTTIASFVTGGRMRGPRLP